MSAKQSAARQQEEVAILSMIQNLVGASITLTSITRLVNEQVPLVSKIEDHAEKRALLKELGSLMVQVGKVAAVLSDGIPRVMAAARLNTGQAGAITELRHTGNVGVDVQHSDSDAQADLDRRYAHMMDMHARARAYVPGTYQGEEQGIIDVVAEPTEGEDSGDVEAAAVSLVPVAVGGTGGGDPHVAEQRLRAALAQRGMPSAQIDRTIERTRARCEQLARSMSDLVDEVLAAPPGQASN